MAFLQPTGKVAQVPFGALGSTQAFGLLLPPVATNWVPGFMGTVEQAPLKVLDPGAGSSMEYPWPNDSGAVHVQSEPGTAPAGLASITSISVRQIRIKFPLSIPFPLHLSIGQK
jgi:hypothetical protein